MTLSRVALLFGMGSLSVAPLASQELHASVGRLKPGALVRVHHRDGDRFAGRLQYVGADALALGPTPGYATVDSVVPLAAIDSVWVLEPRGRRGLLIGAAVGGAIGFGIGSGDLALCPGEGGCNADRAVPTLVGMAIGGGLGWLIGDSHHHWAQHFP